MPVKLVVKKGDEYGRLVIIKEVEPYVSPSGKTKQRKFLCQCECGNETIVQLPGLRSGNTESCGCLHRELVSEYNVTHGASKTLAFGMWKSMIMRCCGDSRGRGGRTDYQGRGITVCDEWLYSFEDYREWLISEGWSEGCDLCVDRINNDGNYSPENCELVTSSENNNNRRNTIFIDFNGTTKPLASFARELNMSYGVLNARYHKGWPPKKMFNTPCGEFIEYISTIHPINKAYHDRMRVNRSYDPTTKQQTGKGSAVCPEWRDKKHGMARFKKWCLENGWKKGLQLDRIRNDRNYEPDNCRWVTRAVNIRNTTANRHLATLGCDKIIVEWAEITCLSESAIRNRLDNYDWSPLESVLRPSQRRPTTTGFRSPRLIAALGLSHADLKCIAITLDAMEYKRRGYNTTVFSTPKPAPLPPPAPGSIVSLSELDLVLS